MIAALFAAGAAHIAAQVAAMPSLTADPMPSQAIKMPGQFTFPLAPGVLSGLSMPPAPFVVEERPGDIRPLLICTNMSVSSCRVTSAWTLLTITGLGLVSHDAGWPTEAACAAAAQMALKGMTVEGERVLEETRAARREQFEAEFAKQHPPRKPTARELKNLTTAADALGFSASFDWESIGTDGLVHSHPSNFEPGKVYDPGRGEFIVDVGGRPEVRQGHDIRTAACIREP